MAKLQAIGSTGYLGAAYCIDSLRPATGMREQHRLGEIVSAEEVT